MDIFTIIKEKPSGRSKKTVAYDSTTNDHIVYFESDNNTKALQKAKEYAKSKGFEYLKIISTSLNTKDKFYKL